MCLCVACGAPLWGTRSPAPSSRSSSLARRLRRTPGLVLLPSHWCSAYESRQRSAGPFRPVHTMLIWFTRPAHKPARLPAGGRPRAIQGLSCYRASNIFPSAKPLPPGPLTPPCAHCAPVSPDRSHRTPGLRVSLTLTHKGAGAFHRRDSRRLETHTHTHTVCALGS